MEDWQIAIVEINTKMDAQVAATLASKNEIEKLSKKINSDTNGDKHFYQTIIKYLIVALFAALGLTAAIDYVAGAVI